MIPNYTARHFSLTLMLVLVVSTPNLSAEDTPGFAQSGMPFLQQYCLGCHSGEQPPAELALDLFVDNASLIKHRQVWDRVLEVLIAGQMPPPDSDQPSVAEVGAFTDDVLAIFDHADRNAKPHPGRVTVRRLNRTEYKNTVHELLDIDFDPTESFPADDIGHGFDNIGDVLTLSPLLMERYLDAAEAIAHRVILVDPPPPSKRYRNGRSLDPRNDKVPEGRYRLLDPTAKEPWESGPFTTDGRYLKFLADAEIIYRATLYAETDSQSPVQVALFVQGDQLEEVSTPDELARLMGTNLKPNSKIKILKIFEITARDPKKPQTIEVQVNRMAHVKRAGIAMVKPENGQPPTRLQIRHLSSEGPLETRPATQFKILACSPDKSQAEQTREVLTRLLRRGYRRPPSQDEVERLAQFVESVQASGQKWEAGIQQAIKVILCSPKFLFRLELDDRLDSPEPRPIDEFHLASRLSYFLWSSMPDDELLDLAENNQLTANLESQVKRMLAEPKVAELVRNFGFQWLQIQRLATVAPDPKRFPTFNPKLRAAMLKETELFLESIIREDRSILDLLDANYTFLNQSLANHYGIADTKGNWIGQPVKVPGGKPIKGRAFRRVDLQGRSRGGILTQASVLTVTSNPTRTSPVKRGRWVLEQILGSPPPPPPPDVPELAEDKETVTGSTLRQRLEQHRQHPSCANCHAKMDPIGFALENYNAIGAFRSKDGEFEIDASGQFPDGTSFNGPGDLKGIIIDRKDLFVRCLTEKMLTYALGRGLAYYDRPTIEQIATNLESNDYKFSALVTEIVKSDPFRLRGGIPKSELKEEL
ncbi:DUF1592 domain-containing protein [Candidatus Poribacteria bacterium]|nr:DUF1592 domain-containing protein [Candidatus Poribacteria bacterium]